MKNNYIHEFKLERDLGSIINDTFSFIRDEWRDILNKSWKLLLPFLLMIVISSVYFSQSIGGDFTNTLLLKDSFNFSDMFKGFGLFAIASLLFYVFAELVIFYYIKLYVDNDGNVEEEELKELVFKNVLPLIILHIIIIPLVYLGFMFFIIPGIYLAIALIFAPFIFVFEDEGIWASISQSLKLISGNWWITFGTLFVISLVFGLMGYIFSLPLILYQYISPFTNDTDVILGVGEILKDPIFLVLSIISTIGQYLISFFSLIAVVFTYFDLHEQKTFRGTYDKIDDIGREY